MRVIKKDTSNAPEPQDYCFTNTAIIFALIGISLSQTPTQASPDQSSPSNDSTNQIYVIPNTVTPKTPARTTEMYESTPKSSRAPAAVIEGSKKSSDTTPQRQTGMKEFSTQNTCSSPFPSLLSPKENADANLEFVTGYALQRHGKLKEAAKSYEVVVKSLPDSFEAYYNLGLCQREQGDLRGALKSFEKTAMLHPFFKLVYQDLADLYSKAGQASNAQSAMAMYNQL
ncbi:MAG: tetratricopeptide repeat protein [Candidatus Obscuribacterales bacterium]|nr:tetratricopeptide repeat protein [Candidatus Obscuribacterales bacterium]